MTIEEKTREMFLSIISEIEKELSDKVPDFQLPFSKMKLIKLFGDHNDN